MTAKVKDRPKAGTPYEADFSAWLYEQAELIRSGLFSDVDAANVAEELEGMARSEFSKLVGSLRVLVMQMLKWDQQPEYRSKSWVFSIREHRRRYADLIKDNPSLKPKRDLALERAYRGARDWAADETAIPDDEFPKSCPYGWDDLLDRPFEMDAAPGPK